MKSPTTWRSAVSFSAAIEYNPPRLRPAGRRVKKKLLEKINQLSDDKNVHRADPYKINNDGCYLYFELLKYRIVYYAVMIPLVQNSNFLFEDLSLLCDLIAV